jgi:1-acyl-sn-glycerol-3-phosphate acyltransferase
MEDEARRTLLALGVGIRRFGPTPPRDEPLLVVANHVSWLDVHVLSAGRGARFVAKAETRHWPVVGTVTQAVRRDLHRARQLPECRAHQGRRGGGAARRRARGVFPRPPRPTA